MKVKELYIKKYHQFEDFHLNLTYPEGHEKAGQPLDKVCFIGQSGTGKTSLLHLIKYFMDYFKKGGIYLGGSSSLPFNDLMDGFYIKPYFTSFNVPALLIEDQKIWFVDDNTRRDIQQIKYRHSKGNPNSLILENKEYSKGIMDSMDDFFDKVYHHDIIITFPDIKTQELFANKFNNESYDENQLKTYKEHWNIITRSIIAHREREIEERLKISEIVQNPNIKQQEILEATQKFQKWVLDNPNPLNDLADNFLDKILNKFGLRVRQQLDFQTTEDISLFKIENLRGELIPYNSLSTGTRHVIESATPLYGLKFEQPIILFDEPEKSLYPDIQTFFVDFYTSYIEKGQFFFATHSPLVASSFEPWEIVELKFNEETGNVYQELYYDSEKGRHVDNYTIDPRYLRWDGILKKVFDLEKEGNDMRVSELVNLATLESQLKNNNLSPEQKKEKFEEYKKLANLLNWDLN